jgi:N-acetylmuramoyl-L-alanine amidase
MQRVSGYVNELPLLGRLIYLDPGHGGVDPGAIYKDIYEETITLQITKKLQLELEKKGAIVYLTREGDYDLSIPYSGLRKRSDLTKRINLINSSNCDMYLSVHLNASNSTSWKGAQVFYNVVNAENKVLAGYLQDSFKKDLRSNRTIKEIRGLYMYRSVKRLGLLLEVGFLTNPNERYLMLKDYYQQSTLNFKG